MKQRVRFEKELNNYYNHLLERFENGGNYIDKNNCNESSKEYKAYESIIKELSQVESLINYYKLHDCV